MSHPILLVEDDDEVREMLATLLASEGHQVVTAINGRQALDLARRHQPALILLDLMMPVMSGEEFLVAQAAADDIRGIPVVVLSAHPNSRRIASELHTAGCLPKPVDLDALLTVCESVR